MQNFLKQWCLSLLGKPVGWKTRCLRNGFLISLLSLGSLLNPSPMANSGLKTLPAQAQTQQPKATAKARDERRQKQERQVRPENYNLSRFPITNANERHWRNILWTTAVVTPEEEYVAQSVTNILAMSTRSGLSSSQIRTIDMAFQVGTQLYLANPQVYSVVGQQFLQTIERSNSSEWVAMALSGLVQGGLAPEEVKRLSDRVRQRFPKWSADIFLLTSLREIQSSTTPSTTPPLRDLLNWTIAPRELQLYVICRPDRWVLCRAVLKNRDGRFVYQGNQLWSTPLLLRSIHGLNWNFVRGETPQGVYRMEGVVPQPDREFFRAYGQFALVNLFVPFEPGARKFLPNKAGSFKGDIDNYRALLPPSWRGHFPIEQTFWAGKVGRSLFRIHGTGESPEFFGGKENRPDSYNWNPTIGCLSALELYDSSGTVTQADMPNILNALVQNGGKNFSGYMVVVEIPGASNQPISAEEIEAALQ